MKNTSVPIVGGFYADETKSWTSQDCLNWIPTQAESAGTLTPMILKTPPGLKQFSIANPLAMSGHFPVSRIYDVGSYPYVVSGGVQPYSAVTLDTGSLPPWASLSPDGTVTYDITSSGTWAWSVKVSDAQGSIANVSDGVTVASEIFTHWVQGYTTNYQVYSTAVSRGIVFVGIDSSHCAYSKDGGSTFTLFNPGFGTRAVFNVTYFDGAWYAFDDIGDAAYCVGDSFAFTSMPNAPAYPKRGIAVLTTASDPVGHIYEAVSSLLVSGNTEIDQMLTRGSAWNRIDTGHAFGDVVCLCQAGDDSFFGTVSGNILKTSDFVTFTPVYNTSDADLKSCAYLAHGNILLFANSVGKTYRSVDGGSTWTTQPGAGAAQINATRQQFVAAKTTTVLTSPDGLTWTPVFAGAYQISGNFACDATIAAVGTVNGYVYTGTP